MRLTGWAGPGHFLPLLSPCFLCFPRFYLKTTSPANLGATCKVEPQWSQLSLSLAMILTLLLGLGGYLSWGLPGAGAQDPGTRFSDPQRPRVPAAWEMEVADASRDSIGRNWCPYQISRLVTYIAACKTEKLLVHSQQPCPQGAPDCQRVKVMYPVVQKPVYQVQQKVLTSQAWRCCPGFHGPDCQDYGHPGTEFNEIKVPQEHLLQNLQNDAQLAEDDLPGTWEAPASNLTAERMEANQTEFGFSGRISEHLLQPHIDAFLKAHFNPMWKSFGESLHSLSKAIRNLSLDVEANHQAVKMLQEGTVTRADLQELGAKFDAKVQENNQRVGRLQQDVEDQLHAQRRALHHALSEVQAEMSTKLKQLVKAQEVPGAEGSLVVASAAAAAARPEPESLQARLGQLQRNISALYTVIDQKEEELQSTIKSMDSVLNRHVDEIKELYSESDETFDQISKVERQVEELLVNHTGLRELRVILMEKSLIMEENKEEMERQLLELNFTLQHLQAGHADLIKYVKDCNCQRLYSDMDVIREGQRDAMRTLEETQVSLDEQHQLDGSSLQALQSTVDAMSSVMDKHKVEGEQARAERARMRSQLRALDHAVEALKTVANQTGREMRQLHSSFAALLEDALRHQAVLAALFGEEMMEEMSEEAPRPLPLNYDQIRLALQDAASGLQEQAFGWDALATRVEALEQHPQLAERLEPSHDSGREEEATALANLEQEIQRLSSDVKQVGQCCDASWAASLNGSLEDLHSMLSDTRHSLRQHQQLFRSLFQNFQELVASNISLDLGKLHTMLSKKDKKQQIGASRKREKKQVVTSAGTRAKGMEKGVLDLELWEAGSPVAFYGSSSEVVTAVQMVKFNTTSINVGSGYFPEHGYFRAPRRGVYWFAVSITFGPGPGVGQLVLEGHRRVPVHSAEQRGGSTATAFAMAELQKGERVWFELIQGSVTKGSQPHAAFGGFLLFKT
ncbi:multimerin-2 isoform X3 [Peromyscus californicus insignis]|uniref:multimerin-2 isoform X3 n=1 Tax=Peromyscus californicus insignis TaxID=564181 RepID=UPI0022A7E0E5|nr:multimerin-2 isoform X3 [Peromyscus californicus insignis]